MITIIFNHQLYDGTDIAWNGLRLVKTPKPDSYDYDLVEMLKKMYASGINLQVCGTCNARCGL